MKNGQIFTKTIPFVFLRLLAQVALLSVVGAYAALVLLGINLVFGAGLGSAISIFVMLIFGGIGIGLYKFASRYVSYLIKSAHVAVITELVEHGSISSKDGIVSYGLGKVKQRFASTSVFFVLDGLIAGAVRQIQNGITAVAGLLNFIPGLKVVVSIFNKFVGIVLNYVDEAVLSHIFRTNSDNAWKGAADGIVLYFQNWKEILKNAAIVTILLLVWNVGGSIALFLGLSGLFNAIIPIGEVAIFVAVFMSVTIVLVIKSAVIDPLILISIINKYTVVTTGQTPAIDMYEKARKFSTKFRKIEEKSGVPAATTTPADNGGTPQPTAPADSSSAAPVTSTVPSNQTAAPKIQTKFAAVVNPFNPVGMVANLATSELMNRGIDAANNKMAENHEAKQAAQTQAPPAESPQTTNNQEGAQK
jgi:hypothetical protein